MTDGYLPTLDSALEAAQLIQAFDRHDPSFGDLLFAATPGTTWALVTYANRAIGAFATLANEHPDEVLQELRITITDVIAAMANEGEAS